jgi:C4-dicarboxylate-specific signal transduction histidine kinase
LNHLVEERTNELTRTVAQLQEEILNRKTLRKLFKKPRKQLKRPRQPKANSWPK